MSVVGHPHVAKSSNRSAPARGKAYDKISLTASQKRLIRESFRKLEPALDLVGQLFFLKLYRQAPVLRARFGGTAETQGRKFMAATKLAIISLNHDDGLGPILKLLGVRHRQMGIKLRDYRAMTRALMWTLERSLEKSFTDKTKDAWTTFLTQAARTLSGSDAALLRSV
jgi:hemoglobin-like flavoprotein